MREIEEMKQEMKEIEHESHSLAYELILELKKRGKRDFIAIMVLISLIFLSNIAWILYINQYDFSYETLEQYQENTTNSHITGEIN